MQNYLVAVLLSLCERLLRAHYFRAHLLVSWAHGFMAHRLDFPVFTNDQRVTNCQMLTNTAMHISYKCQKSFLDF